MNWAHLKQNNWALRFASWIIIGFLVAGGLILLWVNEQRGMDAAQE